MEAMTNRMWMACAGLVMVAGMPGVSSAVEWDKVTFRGFLQYQHKSFLLDHQPLFDNTNNELRAQLELTFDLTDEFRIRVTPEAYTDVTRRDSYRHRVYFNEGYGQVTKGDFDLRFGKQIVTWGQADTVRPTDVWRRRDYSDFFLDTEEGVLGLRADFTGFGPLTVQGVFVPYFVPDIFPFGERHNRFFHAENVYRQLGQEMLNNGAPQELVDSLDGFRVSDGANLPNSLRRSEGGIRISGSFDGWDVSASYASFFNRVPTSFQMTPPAPANPPPGPPPNTYFGDPDIQMALFYHRVHMIGFDFVKLFGKLGIRTEAAYFFTEDRKGTDPRVDDPYFKVTTGFDYEFTNIIGDSDLTLIAQIAIDEELPRKGTTINQKEGINLIHFYRYAFVGTATWKFTEYFKVQTPFFVNAQNGDYLVQPEFNWSPVDGFEVIGGGDIVGGDRTNPQSFFSVFDRDDRVRMALKYSW